MLKDRHRRHPRRVWWYFCVVALRNFGMGLTLLVDRSSFGFSPSFHDVFQLATPLVWAVALLTVGVVLGWAVVTKATLLARIGIAAAGTLALMFGTAFFLAWCNGHGSFWGPLVYVAMALEDFIVISAILHTPHDPTVTSDARRLP